MGASNRPRSDWPEGLGPEVFHRYGAKALKERERRIVRLGFGLDGEPPRSLGETGAIVGVTGERARQIQATAMRKLLGAIVDDEGFLRLHHSLGTAEAAAMHRLGRNLSRMRRRRRISQVQLARLAQLTIRHISMLERGQGPVPVSVLIKLAASLECRVDDLLDGVRWRVEDGSREGSLFVDSKVVWP